MTKRLRRSEPETGSAPKFLEGILLLVHEEAPAALEANNTQSARSTGKWNNLPIHEEAPAALEANATQSAHCMRQ
ncbi:MAG TPA: hypothetical protein VGE69_10610 [Pseudomonadales bacterium]